MAFQGFARDQRFSTHQIDIDISSVINSDLAEAKRMSGFMAKNAEMGEKHSKMYLNALVQKHEVEKRDREKNFKFFMDNRNQINEWVKYNNKVKYEDAGIDTHVKGLDSILGEGLLQLATSLGSSAISGAIARSGEAAKEAKAQELSKTKNAHERYWAESSDAQRKLNSDGYWEEYADANAERKIELRNFYNSQGKHQVGEISVAYQNKFSGMEDVERRGTRFSQANLAAGYLEYFQNNVVHINGIDVTAADIAALPHNDATVIAFLEETGAGYFKESGLLDEGGPENNIVFSKVRKSVEGSFRQAVWNSNVQDATVRNQESQHHRLQLAKDQGGINGVIDILFNPNNVRSIAAEMGQPYAVDFFKRAIKNGAFTLEELNGLYAKEFGPGGVSINEDIRKNTARGREYAALRAAQVDNEQQQHQRQQDELTLKRDDFILQAETFTPEQARHLLESINNPRSDLGKSMVDWNQDQTRRLITTLSRTAGVLPAPKVDNVAQKMQKEIFSESWVNETVETVAMDILSETKQQSNNFGEADLNKAKGAVRRWLQQQVINSGSNNPGDILGTVDSIIGNDNNPAYVDLKKMLAIKTEDDKGTPIKPVWTYLQRKGAEDEFAPEVTGVQQYEAMVAKANGPVSNLKEVYQNPQIKAAMKRLHMRLQSAKDANFSPQQIQHILTNHGTPFIKARQKQGKLSVGMIVNESAKHGGYDDMDFQPLDDSVFLNRQEIEEVEQMIPKFSQMSSPLAARLGQQLTSGQGFTPASHVRGGFEGTVPENERYRSGDVGTANDQGVFRNQFYADQAASIAEAYPNMTWTSTLRNDTHNRRVGGVEDSKHKKGISFDVDGPDAQRLKQDIDSGKVQGVTYYIGPGYSHVHFDITGPVSIAGQQQQQTEQKVELPPATVNPETLPSNAVLAPWTPEGNTPIQQTQAAKNNEIMQEWLSKVDGMWLPPQLRGGYGND